MMKRPIVWIVCLWGLLDLLTAACCEIHADEAYYRLYGQYLAWGYFDHPPLVGVLTFLSARLNLFHALPELSVRLLTPFLHGLTVWLLWLTCKQSVESEYSDKYFSLGFILLAGSMVMFSVAGFMTTPDAPLLFFAALFLYAYRSYMALPAGAAQGWSWALLLGLSIAGMLYSKYMAVLVVAFVVLGNLRLVRDGKMWAALGVALLLFLPHLWWQYQNGFPSFSYHLADRATGFRWSYLLEFIPNQLLVFNPLLFVLMLIAAWHALRGKDVFRRSAAVLILGFQLFFLLTAFRGHVEPHWTMVSSVPAVVLLMDEWCRLPQNAGLFAWRWVRGTLVGCFVLVMVARGVLCLNILPARLGLAGKKPYYEAVHEVAKDMPVVFDGSFQRPSLYRFWYQDNAVLVRRAGNRYTQYDLLHLEQSLQGKPVCIVARCQGAQNVTCNGFTFPCKVVEHFRLEDME